MGQNLPGKDCTENDYRPSCNASVTFALVAGGCLVIGRFYRYFGLQQIKKNLLYICGAQSHYSQGTRGASEDVKSIFESGIMPSTGRSPSGHWQISEQFSERGTGILQASSRQPLCILQTSQDIFQCQVGKLASQKCVDDSQISQDTWQMSERYVKDPLRIYSLPLVIGRK